jgi:hypothetical protein
MAKSYGSFTMASGSTSRVKETQGSQVHGQGYHEEGNPERQESVQKRKAFEMSPLVLSSITRALRRISNVSRPFYLVGGVVTEGSTLRDLDFVVQDAADIKRIQGVLGKLKDRAHFILQNTPPSAATFIKFTGKMPAAPRVPKPARVPNEYANPA